MRRLEWDARAWNDYLSWQGQDPKTLIRINKIIQEVLRDPFAGIGKPEKLRGDRSGFWSRRIDDQNRLIYAIEKDKIVISACKGHYDD